MDLLNLEKYNETMRTAELVNKSMKNFDSSKIKRPEQSVLFLKKVNLDKGKSKKKLRRMKTRRMKIRHIIRNKSKGIWNIPDNF